MSDEEQLKAAALWRRFRGEGFTGMPNLIDSEKKAEWFVMVGFDNVWLMVQYAELTGARWAE